jgi:hypothetical protein
MSGDDEAPPEVHHYEYRGEVPWDIQKYVLLFQFASRNNLALTVT